MPMNAVKNPLMAQEPLSPDAWNPKAPAMTSESPPPTA